MFLITPLQGRKKLKVRLLTGRSVVVVEDHLNLKTAEMMKSLLEMRGDEVIVARDEAIVFTKEDHQAIVDHIKPDKEIIIGKDFIPCNFNDPEDVAMVTSDFELIDRISEFVNGI